MRIPRGALVTLVAVASIVHAGNFAPQDPDLGLHLAVGKIISEEGQQPLTDRFTYTTENKDFVNFEWAFDWASYALYDLGGSSALWLTKLLFIVLIGGLLFALAHLYARGDPMVSSSSKVWLLALILLSVPAYRYRLVVRPHMVGYFMLLLHLVVLRLFIESNEKKARLFLGSVLIGTIPIWAAMHGSWPLALAIGGLHFLLSAPNRRSLAILLLLEVIVLLPNPHGLALLWVPFEHLLAAGGGPVPEEWMAPDSVLPSSHILVFYGYVILFGLTALSRRPTRFLPELILGLLLIIMASKMARFVAPALLVTLPLTAIFIAELTARLQSSKVKLLKLLAVTLGLTSYVSLFAHPGQEFPNGTEWNTDTMPRSASAMIQSHGFEGKIFNDFDIGNDLCWTLGATHPHTIDGRVNLFGSEGLKEYLSILNAPELFQGHVHAHGVQMVLLQWSIPRNQRLTQHLMGSKDYGLAHMDARYALWVRDKALQKARSQSLIFEHLRLPVPPFDLTTMVVSLQSPNSLMREVNRLKSAKAGALTSLMELNVHSLLSQQSAYTSMKKRNHAASAIEAANHILNTHPEAQTEALYARLRRGQARLVINDLTGARSDFEALLKHMDHPEAKAGLRKISERN